MIISNFSAFIPRLAPAKKEFLCLIGLLVFVSFDIQAMNIDSEKRWAEQLRDNIVIGEPLDLPLNSGSEKTFFSIFTQYETSKPKGAIILMHGSGAHPDWGDIIHPLRVELPDKGWSTLSIQMPLEDPEQKDPASRKKVIDASVARIEAAIQYLKAKQYQKVVFIAHSFGTLMALNLLQQKPDAANADKTPLVSAAIIIGTPSFGTEIPHSSPKMIEKIKIPLLDMYGSLDLDSVMRSAKARKTAAKKMHHKHSRQVETIGANHFYNGLDDELVSYVNNWLNKVFYP
ncbi:DUF3530 family protein [sulfur-oxidizing endosymbiont of Gigantopelta aegis]|uniref:DUF3530 family protein n=1 Tax=sulfur-oxidizing endosymbiont of Gigantopelta aegis TaxID=2794934 RepID=UPI0018DC7094|nr:DUF3530 family protein [sulfur-oxidizing endosymbiont of Gigantopelta aegis]